MSNKDNNMPHQFTKCQCPNECKYHDTDLRNKHQFTPGPWRINPRDTSQVETEYCYAIADCNFNRKGKEDFINARLIAAAPELLEILKMIIRYDETTPLRKPYTDQVYKPLTNLLREKATQVISKAQGGAQ